MDLLPVKMYKVVVGYTDLPLLEEETDATAKIREVDVVAYTPGKGCWVLWGGKPFCLPVDRVYKEPGRQGAVDALDIATLEELPESVPE